MKNIITYKKLHMKKIILISLTTIGLMSFSNYKSADDNSVRVSEFRSAYHRCSTNTTTGETTCYQGDPSTGKEVLSPVQHGS